MYGPFDSIALSGAPLHEQILTGRQIELPVREYFSGRRFRRIRRLAGFPGRGQGMPETRGGRQGKGKSQTGAFIGIVILETRGIEGEKYFAPFFRRWNGPGGFVRSDPEPGQGRGKMQTVQHAVGHGGILPLRSTSGKGRGVTPSLRPVDGTV